MDAITEPLTVQRGHSRRRIIRKAAYAAPLVFVIAAAPKVALGESGATSGSASVGGSASGGGISVGGGGTVKVEKVPKGKK